MGFPLGLVGGILLVGACSWAIANPHKDFEIGKKIDPQYIGVDNKDELELNRVGIWRNRIGYGIGLVTGLILIYGSLIGF